ncbi:MAG: hypothetical protein A2W29_08535 [Gemmatimonadetes bacterium RBG_16_66_8]|nr:MAG: hypothetical protein A2W29_08535 [Gemmatimonadetes bacterium RBG_16_66_8]
MTTDDQQLVTPFVSEHFAALSDLDRLLAPPYDVIAEQERAALAARDKHNIVHLILPEGDGDRYRNAATTLDGWRQRGILVADPAPATYVVQQQFVVPNGQTLVRTGLIGAVVAEPFSAGRVKPHERTHAGPKQDRLALMRATHTMFESLLMLTRDPGGTLTTLLSGVTEAASWATAQLGETVIRLWRVQGAAAERLARAAGRDVLYIADGHHRFETAVAFRAEYPAAVRTLALIVPLGDPGLVVLPTHRILYGGALAENVVDRVVAHTGPVDAAMGVGAAEPGAGTCIVVFSSGRRMVLARRQGIDPVALETYDVAVRRLDVAWADACVLATLWAAATEPRVAYSSQGREVVAEVTSGRALAGVLLAPPAVADVLDVADAGAFMPQKSTYFLPKVPSGLVLLRYAAV